jgi:hypothetical protein
VRPFSGPKFGASPRMCDATSVSAATVAEKPD